MVAILIYLCGIPFVILCVGPLATRFCSIFLHCRFGCVHWMCAEAWEFDTKPIFSTHLISMKYSVYSLVASGWSFSYGSLLPVVVGHRISSHHSYGDGEWGFWLFSSCHNFPLNIFSIDSWISSKSKWKMDIVDSTDEKICNYW